MVADLTGGYGADVALECSGAAGGAAQCLELLKSEGSYTQVGIFGAPIRVDLDAVVIKQLRVQGSICHTWQTWERTMAFLASGWPSWRRKRSIDLSPLISTRLRRDRSLPAARPSRRPHRRGAADHNARMVERRAERFVLVASELVFTEAAAGDADALALAWRLWRWSPVLTPRRTLRPSLVLLELGAFPREATADAAHVGIAATNRVDYLLTWNLRHIANATDRASVPQGWLRAAGHLHAQ